MAENDENAAYSRNWLKLEKRNLLVKMTQTDKIAANSSK